MKTISLLLVLAFCIWCLYAKPIIGVKNGPIFRTVVTTRNVTKPTFDTAFKSKINQQQQTPKPYYRGAYIDVQIVDKPHNLFIGRCTRDLDELHSENVILNNDGKSHVTAEIMFNVDTPVDIKCVKVLDQNVGVGAYPSYIAGGVGHNFVAIGVATRYGKGFHFFVQIMGDLKSLNRTDAVGAQAAATAGARQK